MQQFFGQGGPFGHFFGPHMRQGQPQLEHGMGSGVVISPDGYIVTNKHVVDGAVDIRVTTSNRRVMKAKLIGTDPLTDLAVLKVNATDLASVPWGDSKEVRPGQTVLAFGNFLGDGICDSYPDRQADGGDFDSRRQSEPWPHRNWNRGRDAGEREVL